MNARDLAVSRARRALEATSGPDAAPVHPGYELLEAYVDGRLDASDRAQVEALAAQSREVAEDLADLTAQRDEVRDGQVEPTVGLGRPKGVRMSRVALVAGIAASTVLAVWLGNRSPRVTEPARVAESSSQLNDVERTAVAQSIANQRVNPPAAIVALAGKEGTLLGSTATPATFGPVAPLATAVLSTRPMFEWTGNTTDRYTVALFDENFTEVTRGTVSGTSWTPDIELRRGAIYRWQITAHRASGDVTAPAPPQPEARFAILDTRMAALVADQRARLSNEPLALGILLADAGLLSDARIELSRAQQTPATAVAAKTLLQSLSAR